MDGIRREDLTMKIPALFHLSRLGYVWLSPGEANRDRETNILPAVLGQAVEKINGRPFPQEELSSLLADLRFQLDQADLGYSFMQTLQNGWRGWRLLDTDAPERNLFHAASELPCIHGSSRFRPDITLFVNGLPLAMIEVKAGDEPRGIRTEYDRMRKRFRNPAFRRFLQCAQVWVFSDGHTGSAEQLIPETGSFYAGGSGDDFPVYAFREKHAEIFRALPARNRDAERRILADHGLVSSPKDPEFRGFCSPSTEFHRLLSSLFSRSRFLFFLTYGIRYGTEPDGHDHPVFLRRLLSSDQFFALWDLRRKAERGFRSLSLPMGGHAGEAAMDASLISLIRDLRPESRIIRILPPGQDPKELIRNLGHYGIAAVDLHAAEDESVLLMSEPLPSGRLLKALPEKLQAVPRVWLIPGGEEYSRISSRLRARLRRADPEALLVTLQQSVTRGGGNYTYLLECADGTLYCGWTSHLAQRVQKHNDGQGAKYTRSRRPVKLVYFEEFETQEAAMSREWHLKRMSRAAKDALIRQKNTEETDK